jgi:hypothetical protein
VLDIADRVATITDKKRIALPITGLIVAARDVPHEDLGVWMQVPGGVRRVFGVEPMDLLSDRGLAALGGLERLTQRLRGALADHAVGVRRAIELGDGLDKVLLVDYGDRLVVWARKLFRGAARLLLEVGGDGAIVVHGGKRRRQLAIHSRHGVTVSGDHVRFVSPDGDDLGEISIPWIEPEDRTELAGRIGALVDTAADTRDIDLESRAFGLAPAPVPRGKPLKRLRWLVPNRPFRR